MKFTEEQLRSFCRKFNRKRINQEEYSKLVQFHYEDYKKFYDYLAKKYINWYKNYWDVIDEKKAPEYNWFTKGKLDISHNVFEKYVDSEIKNKAAIIWEGIDSTSKIYTYQTLHSEVSKLALALKHLGIKKGDRVFIFMPNLPETIISMLACNKIGAIHILYNYKFSPEALFERIIDCEPKIIITSDGSFEEGYFKVKGKIDEIWDKIEKIVKYCIIVKRTNKKIKIRPFKDLWFHELIESVDYHTAQISKNHIFESEDPLFIIYTSTNVQSPQGLVHSSAGYLLWASFTTDLIFDLYYKDIIWTNFDLSTIAGHTYAVYGPLSRGGTSLIFEGVIDYESAEKFYEIIEKYSVTVLYTYPNTLRNLMRAKYKKKISGNTKNLKLIATSVETMEKELLRWVIDEIGNNNTPIIDIWYQTETGGAICSAIPCFVPPKPQSIAKPLLGVDAKIVDNMGNEINNPNTPGIIALRKPMPSLIRKLWKNGNKYKSIYWNKFLGKNYFYTGDSAYYDEDGYIYLTGRVDDVINVEGRRVNLAQIENIIRRIPQVKEVAVIWYHHPRKGGILSAFCVLKKNVQEWELQNIEDEIKLRLNENIGEWINLQEIRFTKILPKGPDGEVLKDILKEIAIGME